MKRVFVSEIDTLLGRKVCDLFAASKEYEITGTVREGESDYLLGIKPLPPNVKSITPSYRTGNVAFKAAVLASDTIVCLMKDDMIEAEAASKMLRNEHYEVEKTLVVVSSVMTWADTINSRKAQEKAERDAERAERIAEGEDVEEEEPIVEEEEEPIVLQESEYQGRVPHSRYQHWKELEVLVKQANSATLHTHVIFSGLLYGAGEEAFADAFSAAWHQQAVPMYTNGTNVVPMIHVQDLAQIVFKTAIADEVSEQRYILAVDRGNHTLGSVLQTIATKMGNGNSIPFTDTRHGVLPSFGDLLSIDLRMDPSSAFDVHAEDEWYAPHGFIASFDRVADEYRAAHNLKPVRALLVGPPRSGKTTLAAQLAAEYRIPHLTVETIIRDYEGHLVQLEASLKNHRDEKRRARKQLEFNQAEEEAREAKEAAKAEKNDNDGDADEDEDDEGEAEEEEDDVSEIGFNNSGYHLLPEDLSDHEAKASGDDEEDEGNGDGDQHGAAKIAAEDEEHEEDDPEDDVIAFLQEQIQRAKEVISLKVREGLQPRAENVDGEAPEEEEEEVDDEGNPIPKPLPAGARLRYVDEALAAMGKWRLQQKDCLNQGYLLDGFPKSVRQAPYMFHSEEVTLPSLEEIREREMEPLPPMDIAEASARVDVKLLPEICLHLYADDELLLNRVDDDDTNPHNSMSAFVKRLRIYKANHDPSKLADTSLITWLKNATTEEVESSTETGFVPAIKPRQMFYAEVSAGALIAADSAKLTMNYLRATLGDRHFVTPTVQEMKAVECDTEHHAQLLSFQAQRAEEKRIEDERIAYEKHQREMAVHARRYRSIAEEKVLAQDVVEMPMETYLAQFVLKPVAKGVEKVIAMRPEDPIQALADFLFEYEPRKVL